MNATYGGQEAIYLLYIYIVWQFILETVAIFFKEFFFGGMGSYKMILKMTQINNWGVSGRNSFKSSKALYGKKKCESREIDFWVS